MTEYNYLHANSSYPINCRLVDIYDLLEHKEAVLLPIQAGDKKPLRELKGWSKLQFEVGGQSKPAS